MAAAAKKVVIVTTSAAYLGDHPTGVWLEELAAPYTVFKAAGMDVTIGSIQGGPIPIDAGSMGDAYMNDDCKAFLHNAEAMGAMSHSVPVANLKVDDFDALFCSGGHGTAVDFVENAALKALIEGMYSGGKIVASVCHGPMCLVQCEVDGVPLVKGKKVSAFTDSEERVVQLEKAVPFLLEEKLRALGAEFVNEGDWQPCVAVDGNLITGQNPASSTACAEAVVKALSPAA